MNFQHLLVFIIVQSTSVYGFPNIIDQLTARGATTFVELLEQAGLTDTLKTSGPYTVIAPTNEAFKNVPAQDLQNLRSDVTKLKNVLLYHIVNGEIFTFDMKTFERADSLNGHVIHIRSRASQRKEDEDEDGTDTVEVLEGETETGYHSADQSQSSTSFDSLDDDTDFYSTDLLTSSEISIASSFSTDSDIATPFPIGEYSTYMEARDRITPVVDFHDILNSPVVHDNIVDARMVRSCSPLKELFNCGDDNREIQDDVEMTIQAIVNTYSDIVPPLKPNTGEIIHVPKLE
ncbi:hypothetical protein ACF0H5_010291 [Mactra antiquata]